MVLNETKIIFSPDPWPDQPRGEEEVHSSCFPQCVRQDQSRHDHPDATRVEGGVRRWRHRLDEVRQPGQTPRHQPWEWFLRRCPGNESRFESKRHGLDLQEHDFHKRCSHQRRGRVLEGYDTGCSRRREHHLMAWQGELAELKQDEQKKIPAAHPNSRFCAQLPTVPSSTQSGRTRRACRLMPSYLVGVARSLSP